MSKDNVPNTESANGEGCAGQACGGQTEASGADYSRAALPEIDPENLRVVFVSTPSPSLKTDEVVTQILENNLTHLEDLRAMLERTGNKDVIDVRDFGDTFAGTLLRGIERQVDYFDLVKLINDMKNGIARRRVALAEA